MDLFSNFSLDKMSKKELILQLLRLLLFLLKMNNNNNCFQPVSNQVSEEQVPLKICRGKDDITTFFKVTIFADEY